MTKREAAVIQAFTGRALLTGDDIGAFYAYAEEKLGTPVLSHELFSQKTLARLAELSKPDFLAICSSLTD